MRFLRMLTNALLAGAFGAAYLTIIVLQLNPEVPLLSATPWWWFLTLGMLYGIHFAVLFYVILVVREFVAMDPLSPGWVSVRLLAWLGAALSAGAAILMWFNVRGFALALGELAAWRMTAGAVAATASAIVLLAIAAAHYSFGRRGSRVGASLFAIAVVASMALPIAARGRGTAAREHVPWTTRPVVAELSPGEPRVTVLMLDGASLAHIWPRAAEGRLPNFSRLLDGGAAMDLATIRPTQPDPVWTAVATGMYPAGNGVRSAARYYARGDDRGINLLADHSLSHALVHLGFVKDAPLTSAAWRARPLWGILSDQGMASSIVRWPLTHPANPSTGVIVSDRLHQVVDSIAEYDRAAHPAWVLPAVQPEIDGAPGSTNGAAYEAGFTTASPEDAALQRDLLYARVSRKLRDAEGSRLSAMRYTGLDTVGHYYLQYAQPVPPRGVPEEERRKFAQVVDRYYAFIDAEIGSALAGMAKDDLLLVISGFGMESTGVAKRWLARVIGDADFSGTHERAPDGFMLAYGTAVQPGRPQRGSIVDVTPTLLYFFGLPIARDMDGFARADLFIPEFSAVRPLSFVPSYR
ncbi:MAG: alkaline phosphatase family protein [Acidobacteriota bacterium]|nr:alkaline phosphatase family protein [Acidobacteriota bacterium]